jgi:hypothetical protein
MRQLDKVAEILEADSNISVSDLDVEWVKKKKDGTVCTEPEEEIGITLHQKQNAWEGVHFRYGDRQVPITFS